MATVVTNKGLSMITALLAASTHRFIGWGTGAGTAVVADTTITTEAAEARVSGTQTQETTTEADDTYQVVGTLVTASDQTITNAAVLSALTGGDMLVKGDFAGVALTTGESIQFTVQVQAA